MQVPFVDLSAIHEPILPEVMKSVESIFHKNNFILGEEVQTFENNFSEYCGSKFALGVSNGTDALNLALRAAGVESGDEVLVPANTFIATAIGVTMCGAKPIPVDCAENTFLMDFEKTKAAVTDRTKAILPVHLYGRKMNLDPFLKLAEDKNLILIEDSAQAHGAKLGGKKAGSEGLLGCFSFYPGKNLGAFGDAGMVVTSNEDAYKKLIALRNWGSPQKYHHPVMGFNNRLDTVQAAILNIKLQHLDSWNQSRYDSAVKYNELLQGVGDLILPEVPEGGSHIFHLYVVRSSKRDELLKHYQENGVGSVIHYPTPIHMHGAYQELGYSAGSFPVAEKLANEIVSLPMFPGLTDEQISHVVNVTKDFFK